MNQELEAKMHPNQVAAMMGAALAGGAVVACGLMVFLLNAVAFEAAHLRSWSLVALFGCVGVLVACAGQWLAWRRALAVLRGEAEKRLIGWEKPSWWLHVASYLMALVAVVALAWVAAHAPFDAVLFWLAAAALIMVLAGQAMGATQYLRFDGPPGTIPAHVRRWIASANARADARADETGPGVSAG